MSEGSDGMPLHRYAMLVDLIVEGFAEDDCVSRAIRCSWGIGVLGRKPKVDAIKKMKTRRINQWISIGMILRVEKDGRCEDSLETLNDSPIMAAVRSETEEIEHLKGSFKVDDPALLLDG